MKYIQPIIDTIMCLFTLFLMGAIPVGAFMLLKECAPKPITPKFHAGDIVYVKLTGERLGVVRRTNKPFVYDERYDVRNHEGYTREMFPYELELEQPHERKY
jgi:hypothetical protein